MERIEVIQKYPHIQRMMRERDELCVKLNKLCSYYDRCARLDKVCDEYGVPAGLTDKQRDLMCKQITAMRSYADILQQRINYDIQYYSREAT